VANLLLSIPLVKMFGLVGVAVGTIVPVAIYATAIFVKTCGVLSLATSQALRQIVWPTLWPAAVVMALLWATRDALPVNLVAVLLNLAAGGLLYAGIFVLFGLDREERRWFLSAFNTMWTRYTPRLATGDAVR
jgi:O-antigen/teichoic acid export membrane protein